MGPELGDRPVHQALGIFCYDSARDRLAFRTYTAAGGGGEASAEIREDGAIVLEFDDPRMGRVRYTITRTAADEWHEIGECSSDGESCAVPGDDARPTGRYSSSYSLILR